MNKFIIVCAFSFFTSVAAAQDSTVVRIARLQINPAQLEEYKAFLSEEICATMAIEKERVFSLFAVADKTNPALITVFEVYASDSAYRGHIKTPHFLKYKTATKDMVKSLELSEYEPILLGTNK